MIKFCRKPAFLLSAFFLAVTLKVQAESVGYISNSSPSSNNKSDSKKTIVLPESSIKDPVSTIKDPAAKEATSNDNEKKGVSKEASSDVPTGPSENKSSKAALTLSAAASTSGSVAAPTNVQVSTVQVEPFSGSANLSIPIAVPAGRGGIQPNLALVYSSSSRQLGNAGVGWNLDLGSIQISTKKGVPKYDGTDIFALSQSGSLQELVADPNTSGFYRMEVEGSFARIQNFTTYWILTDKKGTKYYYGNTSDSKQNDPANSSRVFRWALNRVEDINGNYMTISYLNDQGQLYPQTISYTGNSMASLNLNPYAQVSINYAAASMPSTSYISGFLVKTAKRIEHITLSVGSDVQSIYQMTYKQSVSTQRDLLESVKQKSATGANLPPIIFTYTDTTAKGFQLDTSWNLTNVPEFSFYHAAWLDYGVRIADVNGDGYPDLVQYSSPCKGPTINRSYLNSKQKSWIPSQYWKMSMSIINGFIDPEPSREGFVNYWNLSDVGYNVYTGLVLLDVDADGLVDSIQNDVGHKITSRDRYGNLFYGPWAPNSEYAGINNGNNAFINDGNWYLPEDALINYQARPYSVSSLGATQFGDINGDGYIDVAVARSEEFAGLSHNAYLNKNGLDGNLKGWMLSAKYVTPPNRDFSKGCFLVDVNGDNLSDILCLLGGLYLNTGNGWQESNNDNYFNTFGLGNWETTATSFIDFNGDGLVDILMVGGSDKYVLINTGNGWKRDDDWVPSAANFFDLSTQFLDADANGMVDFLMSTAGKTPAIYTNKGQPADLLINVDNGIGAFTTIQYDSALHYENTYLPFFIPVVKSTTITVNSHSYITNYSYSGGLWDKNYREFQGFQKVTVTDPQGNYVITSFLQEHWLKGRPLEQASFDASGNLYSKTVNQWQAQALLTNNATNQTSKFAYLSRSDSYLYDGNSSAIPKRTAQEFVYGGNPQYGDVTQTINHGEVNAGTGFSIDPNKTITQIAYINNPSLWLLGLPSQTVTTDTTGKVIAKTSFYYDSDTSGTAMPALGRLTSKVNWLGSTAQPDPRTSYTYDAYGNLLTTTDPNGNTTRIMYDTTYQMFPVKTINALNQASTMTYYGVEATPLDNGQGLKGLWGQQRSVTDANNQTAYSVYDTFGRPVASISPLDTVSLPTQQKSYNIQSSYIAVTDTARVSHGGSTTISSVSFYDGLGRLIQTKSLGPKAGQYITAGQTIYDNRGLPIRKYIPRFVSTNLNTLDPIDASVPSSQAIYDPMGRMVKQINPDGTYSTVVYNQWATSTTDENGHMQKSYADAFGRLVQKEEYTGADGRSPYYPAAAYGLYARTTYTYDPQGNLIAVRDDKNNVTSISYDNLGRKISMNDPDMGRWLYVYDKNGNLIAQQDAKGQVMSFQYDALNRLTYKTDETATQPPTFRVNYSYDETTQPFGKGRLGSVTYGGGSAIFIYDKLGREIASNKRIGSVTYNVERQYDALNRLERLQYPDGANIFYTYNQAGQIIKVSDAIN